MTLYAFSPEELFVTAMFSRWETVGNSPLSLVEAAVPDLKDDKVVDECVKSLIGTGMLLVKNDGSIIPSREADMFLRVLQNPDQMIQVSRSGLANMKDYFLCSYGNLWCIYSCTTDGRLHCVNFPVLKENLPEWFKSDILSDFKPDVSQKARMDFTLSLMENLLLQCAQNVYAARANNKAPLSEDDLWFTPADLYGHPDLKSILLSFPLYCSTGQLEELEKEIGSMDKWEGSLLQMAKRGILVTRKNSDGTTRFSYGDMLKEWLNPGGLVDVVFIGQTIPEARSRILYMKRNGYLILEQANDAIRYKSVRGDTDYISLAYGILDF